MDNYTLLEERIKSGLEGLDGLQDKEYSERVKDIAELYHLKLEEDRLNEQRYKTDKEAEAEQLRFEIEEMQRKAELKDALIKGGFDTLKTGIGLFGGGLVIAGVIKAERTDILNSKAFQLATKLLRF